MNQVFINLIVNAAHAIEDPVGESGERGSIAIHTRHEGEHVVVSITDTGGGIPRDVAERIFDPFFTTKDVGRGTGQGLAIARTIVVERHGGTLTFDSDPGARHHLPRAPPGGRPAARHRARARRGLADHLRLVARAAHLSRARRRRARARASRARAGPRSRARGGPGPRARARRRRGWRRPRPRGRAGAASEPGRSGTRVRTTRRRPASLSWRRAIDASRPASTLPPLSTTTVVPCVAGAVWPPAAQPRRRRPPLRPRAWPSP